MTIYQGKQGKKMSGGRLNSHSGKKKRELGKPASLTTISSKLGEVRKRTINANGHTKKIRLFRTKEANVMNNESGKTESVEILDVLENAASKEFRRRDIITKGAILKTSGGNVKVTNRPGQEGYINGVFVKN